jgi:predicted nucleotidyltransferase
MQLTKSGLEVLKQLVIMENNLIIAILYGSQAAGKAGLESDVDLAVAGVGELDTNTLIDLSLVAEQQLGVTVQVRDLRRAGGLFLNQVLTRGTILFCRDDLFLTNLIIQNIDFMTDVYPTYYEESLRQNRNYYNG